MLHMDLAEVAGLCIQGMQTEAERSGTGRQGRITVELTFSSFLIIYFLLVNFCTFLVMFADKKLARHGRQPRAGGNAPVFLHCRRFHWLSCCMYAFRHKTRHRKFTFGVPCSLCLQLAAAAVFAWRFIPYSLSKVVFI